ncbi:hypothetical protein AX766_07030 [Flavobacterium covae]|uniref:hypothetical protein n=1 Tax=Flavobacterium TaxID=237 RepID=UPI0007C1E808|nr:MULTISPECIES: hypothetical protein [Flavobacterium]AND64173.1 hypothetical protein AX766_06985 [Flavobacterium covae]AND64182.1 hypothetical protein AX766_07030 [Flavobacterium covae]PTD14267.1 hypothetical protein C6N29_07390 [Flavobacterium columnare]
MTLINDKLDKINYKLPPEWKIPFYDFIGGKIKLREFEKIVYELSDLESIIGEDNYIELVSFNFSDISIYNDVNKFILEKILLEENDHNCKLFALIGQFYQNDIKSKINKVKNLPEAVLNIFDGAHIEVKWNGVDNPAYDIKFLNEVIHFNRPVRGCLNVLPESSVIIGYAADSYITLLMDNEGIVYISLQITDELYRCGYFLEALTKIFFGLDYGELLCPPAGANVSK